MKKAKLLALGIGQLSPIGSSLFQQAERAIHVGAHKVVGTVNGSVDMTFSGKMHNSSGTVPFQQVAHQGAIADVSVYECVAGLRRNRLQVSWISGISELVEIHQRRARLLHPLQDEVRADKPRTASDQNRCFLARHEDLIVLARKKAGICFLALVLLENDFTR